MHPLLLIAAAGAALLFLQSRSAVRSTVTHGPVTLEAGVPYRITVRVNVGSTSPGVLDQAKSAATASIRASGGSEIAITPALSTLLISYRAVSPKTSTHQVGVDGGSGTILSVTRLDGRPVLQV